MPPKEKFTKEHILEAAFQLAAQEGFRSITARAVAKRLGSSVAPIYTHFPTISALTEAVVEKVFALSDGMVAKAQGKDFFEKVGHASLNFASSYPVLARELVLHPNPYMERYADVEERLLPLLAEDSSMKDLSPEGRRRLLFKMRVFQTGLLALVANGHTPDWMDTEALEHLLFEVGEELTRSANTAKKEEDT